MLGRGHGGQIPDGVERSESKAGNTVGHHSEAQGRGSSKTNSFRRMVVKTFHVHMTLLLSKAWKMIWSEYVSELQGQKKCWKAFECVCRVNVD